MVAQHPHSWLYYLASKVLAFALTQGNGDAFRLIILVRLDTDEFQAERDAHAIALGQSLDLVDEIGKVLMTTLQDTAHDWKESTSISQCHLPSSWLF